MPLISSRLARSYPALPRSVGDARAALQAWLTTLSVYERERDIVLALSEACSNVVIHAYPDGEKGRFRVFAEADEDAVEVTVADDGRGVAARRRTERLGLGLAVIAALADAHELRPGPDGRGTELSMRFTAIQTTTHSGRNA